MNEFQVVAVEAAGEYCVLLCYNLELLKVYGPFATEQAAKDAQEQIFQRVKELDQERIKKMH